ncbi:MAG TPA: SDR family NAD(P)-dependent oxidoreductase [Acidimicrobiales bacterium]|nr:SDR family NAD(P)-dependent oxidoreductase [Acidimicrobiales bacterium]
MTAPANGSSPSGRSARPNGKAANGKAANGKARAPEPIAIVGMRCRVPGADDLDRFWRNLADGVESISVLTPDDMRSAGVPDSIFRLPGYVNASPTLDDVDLFDAGFFGFSARDASLTDPQHRIFLEAAWEALEDAGYDPARFPGAIGVFGGCELSSYLYQLYLSRDSLGYLDGMQLMVTNDKDHLCTQVSYRLNLRGPSVVVQTTCSTSLVAVSMACESLHARRCDMALAGGVTVRVPQRGGYFYTAGSILSPDGHCRPFDATAQGTIVGSGVGLVVLRRLSDALADGDQIRAVVLGFGLNNDGSDKAGYTAPSFKGQAAAISAALEMSGVSPETIGYVEAHGTGTILGDPIEVSALTEAWRAHTDRRQFCGIGSVKSNFGHLSCASGVAGLAKAVLSLEHGAMPPNVHFTAPNPAIDFASSPFYVVPELTPWERNGAPRRAGVSSFGVGGTNAHLIVEEAPERPVPRQRRPHQLLTLSARSEAALDAATERLAAALDARPEVDLADVAFTLHVGRRGFRHRRALVAGADDRAAAVEGLRRLAGGAAADGSTARPVVFMFPGQGSQYPGMAAELYRTEPVVKRAVDHCARVLEPSLGLDLRRLLFPSARRRRQAAEALRNTAVTQPALFTVEHALAELWRSWGVQPAAMIGHSIGEYVAATQAGVMALDDALRVLADRGRLIAGLPPGSMLAVMAPAHDLDRFVGADVSLAAVNAPTLSVLSGPHEAIDRVERALRTESVPARRLHTSHAFHSSMMEPILGEFEGVMADVPLAEPAIPYVASLTGGWADRVATDPASWSAQLRSTVRFADGLRALTEPGGPAGSDAVLVELGPGRTLVTFAVQAAEHGSSTPTAVATLPGPDDGRPSTETTLGALGMLWALGVPVDWDAYHRTERRRRVALPTYPFERKRYWVSASSLVEASKPKEKRDTAGWYHRPEWEESPLAGDAARPLAGRRILVFDELAGLGAAVAERLRAEGAAPVVVRPGPGLAETAADEYALDPGSADAYRELAAAVCATDGILAGVVDCWSGAPPGDTDLDLAATVSLLGPLRLAQALGAHRTVRPLPVLLVARGIARVTGDELLDPTRALSAGVAKVIPQEHPGLRVASVDADGDAAAAVVAELAAGAPDPVVALRGERRFVEVYRPTPIATASPPRHLPDHPVVLITGGLGHMGMILAEAAFEHLGARLVLTARSPLPGPGRWAALAEDAATAPAQRERLERLAAMHARRPEVMVVGADFDDAAQVSAAVDAAFARFGRVDLVVHGAARVDAAAFASASETGPEVVEAQLSPKLRGLLYLMEAMKGREPERWLLHSSISTALGGLGLAAYSAANAVLDALALAGGERWVSVGWDLWDNAAEAKIAGMPTAIQPPEGQEAFLRVLGADVGSRVLVAVADLEGRLDAWVRHRAGTDGGSGSDVLTERHPRPSLATAYVEPRTDTERALAAIWAAQLGVESVGVHDRFFDLGGHSLLAVQVASEIRDRFQIEMPVLQLFQAPTVGELAPLVDKARETGGFETAVGLGPAHVDPVDPHDQLAPDALGAAPDVEAGPGAAAKAGYRQFYDDVSKRLERTGVGEASFFLNYGYVSRGDGSADEARHAVPDGVFNPSSVRLAFELVGPVDLAGKRVLDVGCGRGGNVALLAERFGADAVGVDLAPEAVAFCRRAHRHQNVRFEVGDAEHLPVDDASFDAVTNVESSHTYPDIRAFLAEVRRVLRPGGWFLHTDLLPGLRWAEVRALLASLGLTVVDDREITPNVLASCDEVASTRTGAFGGGSALIDNFLAVPGSAVYEQMASGAWEYRILRSRLA